MTHAEDWTLAADPARRVGRAVEFHAEIGSTNDRAREALSQPDGDGLAVVADLQTAGRGRRGRTWISPAGANLLVSVPLRTKIPVGSAGHLGIAAALAVRKACAAAAREASLEISWPNDIVAGQHKVAGLLVETALEGDYIVEVVFGIGINVNWRWRDMPLELVDRATSLADLSTHDIDRVALLGDLLTALDQEVAGIEKGTSPVDRFRTHDALNGHLVDVDLGAGKRLLGNAAGIADSGSLIVATPAGQVVVSAGEVVHVGSPLVAGEMTA